MLRALNLRFDQRRKYTGIAHANVNAGNFRIFREIKSSRERRKNIVGNTV